jgi:hypothetical protein
MKTKPKSQFNYLAGRSRCLCGCFSPFLLRLFSQAPRCGLAQSLHLLRGGSFLQQLLHIGNKKKTGKIQECAQFKHANGKELYLKMPSR